MARRARRIGRRQSDHRAHADGAGNFSNAKGVGAGVYECRIDFGTGYRVYFGKDGDRLVPLGASAILLTTVRAGGPPRQGFRPRPGCGTGAPGSAIMVLHLVHAPPRIVRIEEPRQKRAFSALGEIRLLE